MDQSSLNTSTEYHPIACESDDSQSSISRSDDIERIPGIAYASDDSADAIQSDSTFVDSDGVNYIGQYHKGVLCDEISDQFLLESEQTSPQPSPYINESFVSHPLSPLNLKSDIVRNNGNLCNVQNCVFTDSLCVPVDNENKNILRSNSSSSLSTERSDTESNLDGKRPVADYERLSSYVDDEASVGAPLQYKNLDGDPIKFRAMQTQLLINGDSPIKTKSARHFVGDVHIQSKYMDSFYLNWNWKFIRQTFDFLHGSFLLVLLCIGVGFLINMPKDGECDPDKEWFQGSVTYEIFVPSFQDADGDGIGDVRGVIDRLDYLESLGVKSVRLSGLLDNKYDTSFPIMTPRIRTYDSPSLDVKDDVQLLAALLHERDMFLLLDVSLAEKGMPGTSSQPKMNLIEEVPEFLRNWTRIGVDGFVFTDLGELSDETDLVIAVPKWKMVLDTSKRGTNGRMMMMPLDLFQKLKEKSYIDVRKILPYVDLIEAHLDVSLSSHKIAKLIEDISEWDSKQISPWISWTVGGIGKPRLATLVDRNITELSVPGNLAVLILQMFLPGSSTIYYGDELALGRSLSPEIGWAALMPWTPVLPNGGFSPNVAWLAQENDWQVRNVVILNETLHTLRAMISASQDKVPIYINGIFNYNGDYKPKKSANYKIRLHDENLLLIDRFYPRRNKYGFVINLSDKKHTSNLSRYYYCGTIIASSHGKQGEVKFRSISLEPGEALAFVLDI